MRIQVLVSNDVHPPAFGLASRVWGLARSMARSASVRLTCAVGFGSTRPAEERVDGVEIHRVNNGHPTALFYLQKLGLLSDYLTADVYRAWPGAMALHLDRRADVWQAESLNLTPLLERAPSGALRVYASQNVEAEWFERVGPKIVGKKRWARHVESLERRAVEMADVVIAVCEEDRETFVRRYGASPDHVWVVDNGYDEELVRAPEPEQRASARRELGFTGERVLVFVGSSIHHNQVAVDDLFRHVVPRLEELGAILLLVGTVAADNAERARAEGKGRVRVVGFRRDIMPSLWASDVALHPMTVGAGSNVKLPMMLAAGLPVLSTPFGLRGFTPLSPYVTVAEVDGFADALARGVQPAPGATSAVQAYSWRGLGARLAERYRERREGHAACAS